MNYYAFSALVNCIASLLVGGIVYFNNKKSHTNVGFSLFSLFISFWSFGYFFWQMAGDATSALFWTRVLMAGAVFAAPSYLYFALALIGKFESRKKSLAIIYFLFGIFFILNFTPFFVNHVESIYGFRFWPMPGPAYHPYLVLFFGCFLYSTYLLISQIRLSKGVAKEQLKYVLIGMTIAWTSGSTNYFLWYKIPVPPFANILTSLYVVIIAYAIIRYRLMDIRIVSRKIFINICSAVFVYGLFYLIIWSYDTFFGGAFTVRSYVVGAVAIPLAMAVASRSNKLVTKFANQHLFLSLYNFQETINDLTLKLTDYNDLDKISDLLVGTIKKSMQLERAGVLLFNTDQSNKFKFSKLLGYGDLSAQSGQLIDYLQESQRPIIKDEILLSFRAGQKRDGDKLKRLYDYMEKNGIDLCLPLLSNRKIIGMIILGLKISGDAYSADDLDLLSALSVRAGTAIDNARLYEEVRDFSNTLKTKVSEQTASLKQTNEQLEQKSKILSEKLVELEKMNNLMIGRELKMRELKNKISELEGRPGAI